MTTYSRGHAQLRYPTLMRRIRYNVPLFTFCPYYKKPMSSIDEKLYHINQIKIMIRLNKGSTDFVPFTFSMLSHPDLAGMSTSYTYPFFTNTVAYPYAMLSNRGYSDAVEFFFNRARFEKVIQKYGSGYVDENALYDDPTIMNNVFETKDELQENTRTIIDQLDYNTEYNIDCMLKLLFPINYSFDKVYTNTYRHQVAGEFNRNIMFNFKRPFSSGNTGIIKHDGKEYVVSGVNWLNDVINHPIYYKFLQSYYTGLMTRKKLASQVMRQVNEKYHEYASTLLLLYKSGTKYKDTIPDPSQYDAFVNELNTGSKSPSKTKYNTSFFTDLYVELKLLDSATSSNTYSQSASLRKSILNELMQKLKPFAKDVNTDFIMNSASNGKIVKGTFLSTLPTTKPVFMQLANTIIQFYLEFNEFNAKSDYKINLKQQLTTTLNKLYDLSIGIKSVDIVYDFITLQIRKLDMGEKDMDKKTAEEKAIIEHIKKNYGRYANMSKQLNDSIEAVTRPARETSNILLRNEINKIRIPSSNMDPNAKRPCYENTDFFRDVYRKYIHPSRKSFNHVAPFDMMLMYIGVNTVGADEKETSTGEQTNEIYVLLDVIDKQKYDSKQHRCKLRDDALANELNYLLNAPNDIMVNTSNDYHTFDDAFNQPPPPPPPTEKTGGKSTRKAKRYRRKTRRRLFV